MVEQPRTLIPPERPPGRHRTKASRGRILVRRLLALAFVFGLLTLLVGSAWAILGQDEEPPPVVKPVAPSGRLAMHP